MPLTVKINVAVREQICQKIGSERVNGHGKWLQEISNLKYTLKPVKQ